MPDSVGENIAAHLEYTRNKVDKRIAQGETRPDLMSAILENNHQGGLTLEELYSNASLLVHAGSQTIAVTCGSVTWFLLKNPSAMEKCKRRSAALSAPLMISPSHQLPDCLISMPSSRKPSACILPARSIRHARLIELDSSCAGMRYR